MNIGIDLDDTINTLSLILIDYAKQYNKEHNIDHDIQVNEWDFDKAFGWDDDHSENFINKYMITAYKETKPKEDAQKILYELKNLGHNIIIITARSKEDFEDVENVSIDWLDRHKIPYDKVVIDSEDKVEKCKEHNIDIFIDDRASYCEKVKEHLNIPVYLFNSIYNQDYNNEKIKRIYSWEEIYREIIG